MEAEIQNHNSGPLSDIANIIRADLPYNIKELVQAISDNDEVKQKKIQEEAKNELEQEYHAMILNFQRGEFKNISTGNNILMDISKSPTLNFLKKLLDIK